MRNDRDYSVEAWRRRLAEISDRAKPIHPESRKRDPESTWEIDMREQDKKFIRHMRKHYPEIYTGDWS